MVEHTTELEKERQNLLIYIWKKRKILVMVSGIAGVVGLIVSLLIILVIILYFYINFIVLYFPGNGILN
jgi:hypothetical protein